MSKVDIKRLDSVTKNDTTATGQINDNFQALQAAIENTVSRDGTVPNYMDADLDLNSYRIINAGAPVEGKDVVTLEYFEEKAGGAIEAAAEAKASASKAASSAQSALVASNNAIGQLAQAEGLLTAAEGQLADTKQYVDAAKADIDATVEAGKQEINTTIDDAQMSLSDTINQAVEDVKTEAVAAAEGAIQGAADTATQIATESINTYTTDTVIPQLTSLVEAAEEDAKSADEDATAAGNYAREAKAWARGEDAEVEEFAPGQEEHSSRGYADLAMAIANTPEDVPVDTSTLLALEIIKGPKGDSGEGEFSGDVNFEGSFNVHGDDNHPVKVTSLAGASASGYQVVDSNGAGESDFEHYASGDRYGTRIANKSTATGKTVNVDLYQTTAGKSVLDLSKPDTILAPQLLNVIYPVGSIYITTNSTCPIEDLGVGTWELVAEDRVLQGAGTRGAVGTELAESLPNIVGNFRTAEFGWNPTGAFQRVSTEATSPTQGSKDGLDWLNFNASRSSSTYQDNAPVQPDAYLVNIFRRVS